MNYNFFFEHLKMNTQSEKEEIIKLRKLLELSSIEIKNLKKENIQIEEEKNKMEENQKIQNEGRVPLSIILEGLPKFEFIRFNRSESEAKKGTTTPHTSNRKKIHIKKDCKISPENIEKLKLNMRKINLGSSKFFDKNTYFTEKKIRYSSENTIQRLVYDYMTDIFDILELTSYVNFYDTTSIVTAINKEELKKLNHPDVTIIRTRKNKPIMAIEIKMPHVDIHGKNILDDDNVIGQIYDYMLSVKSFYNQKYVYGILTTLDKWKILYLPKEKEINLEERIVYESKIYDFSDPDLAKVLIKVIRKSLDSSYYPVRIFDTERNYIEYSSKGCRWKRMEQTQINELSSNINLDIYKNCEKINYTIYKFFQTGRTNQTSLIINNYGSIGVLKQFFGISYDDKKEKTLELKNFEFEAKMWKKIYNINTEIEIINGNPSFITPLIFTLENEYNKTYKKYEVFFRTDLEKIFTYDGAISAELPLKMHSLQSQINRYSQKMNILECAEYAINELAKKKYVHNDLKWQHIGLYPVLKNGYLEKMEPILIDLESLEKKKTKEAKKEMMRQLEIMSKDCEFINNDQERKIPLYI
uniref:Uncharacterized protein n=1 Tax=viral metagenome TaxID=1070528 RepID=A0A6C0AEE4_9ZZZZ